MATAWLLICTTFQFLFWKVPQYGRLALYLQALLLVIASFVFQWWGLVPGVAIGFLGLVAVLLATEGLQRPERAVLIILAFLFLIVELRSIYSDKRKADRERAELIVRENESRKVANESFDALLKQGEGLFKSQQTLASETNDQITGGDSYCYLSMFTALNGFGMQMKKIGKYPLRLRSVSIDDQTRYQAQLHKLSPEVQNGKLSPDDVMNMATQASRTPLQISDFDTQDEFVGGYPFPDGNELNLNITFSAFNGSWVEYYSAIKVEGKWRQAIYVLRFRPYREFKLIEKGYPTFNGAGENWPTTVKH
jgi:hypothetical protein